MDELYTVNHAVCVLRVDFLCAVKMGSTFHGDKMGVAVCVTVMRVIVHTQKWVHPFGSTQRYLCQLKEIFILVYI